ncbi:hypothetical protein HETIRDRAFT_309646 [Heterobasidion irregulare TC 32-1]|uniref:DNA damage-responsive protein 48 n=1 Tax=Heterobasidion irregulare (strain TC 32-1) TaxID=747525 RepID=W4KHR6_HETIT|nr:uncharacterized protein HETIRDRAFT_309646 [Heterobasidion irregulare TC 32-1]ETW85377.1 hypothetical protein HETIRDRAFT_309646 [Heterobasidion irregulare TC 32-1]
MDFIKKNLSHGGSSQLQAGQGRPTDSGGLGGNVNNALGGGQAGEKNEGVDYAQQHVLGQGPQNNESAVEQAKDEQISDAIRRGYKGISGKDFPIKDK